MIASRETIDLLTKVSMLVGELGGGRVAERPRHELELLALFDRCRTLLGSIRLLLAHDFVHEAVMLGRPLFTDSLFLAACATADVPKRVSLVVGWNMSTLNDLERLIREWPDAEVARELSTFAEGRRADLQAYARQRGARARSWRPDDHAKQLAAEQGRSDDHASGRFLSLDPLPRQQSEPYLSSYAYADDRPTVLVDPSGMGAIRSADPWGRLRPLLRASLDGPGPIKALPDFIDAVDTCRNIAAGAAGAIGLGWLFRAAVQRPLDLRVSLTIGTVGGVVCLGYRQLSR